MPGRGNAIKAGSAYVEIRAGDTSHLLSGVTDAARQAGHKASNELESAIGEGSGGKSGEGFAAGFGGKLKAGIAGAALAAGALLAKGIGDALEQGAIKSRIQAQLGATNEVAASAGQVAGKLYAKGITEDFRTAADTIKSVMQSGIAPPGATNDQLQAISTRVADVANVFDQDLGGVTNAVSQMMRTGLAPSAEAALDVITKGMQNGTNKADDLLDTFNEYGTQFRKLGLDGPAALGLISQAVKAGARDSDVAADALKEFSIRAVDGSKTTSDGFKALGLDAEDMAAKIGQGGHTASDGLALTLEKLKAIPDPVARSQAAVQLFGTQAEDLGASLYAMDPSNAVASLGQVGGAAEQMGNTLRDNAQSKIETFKRSISAGFTNAVGNYVVPALTDAGAAATRVFGPAFAEAKEVAGALFARMPSWSQVTTEAKAALSGTADAARTYVLPAFQAVGDVVGGKLLPAGQAVVSAVSSGVLPVFRTVGSILTDTVAPAVMRVYGAVASNLVPIVSAAADGIRQHVAPGVQLLGEKLNEVYVKAQPVISVIVAVTEAVAKFAAKILGEVIPPVLRFSGEVLGALFNALGTAIGWVGNVIDWLVRFGRGVGDAAGAVGRFAGSVSDHFNSFKSAVSNGCSEAVSYVAGVPGRFVNGLSSLGSSLMRAGRDGLNSMKDGVADGAGKVVDEAKALPGKISSGIGNLGSLLVDEGKHVVEGLWNGINGAGDWIKGKVSGFVSSVIPGPIRDALGIHSPSRVTAELGMWAGRGLMVGLEGTEGDMRRSAEGYALGMADALTTAPRSVPARAVGTAPALARDAMTAEAGSVRSHAAAGGITVNVRTDADPYEIGRAIAWDTRFGGGRTPLAVTQPFTGEDWTATFGGVLLGGPSPIVLQEITGLLDAPEVRGTDKALLQRNGLATTADYLGGRIVHLSFVVLDGPANVADALAGLQPGGGLKPFRFAFPGVCGGAGRLMAKVRKRDVTMDAAYVYGGTRVAVELFAPDPLLYADSDSTATILPTVPRGSAKVFPFRFPFGFMRSGAIGMTPPTPITVDGSTATWPVYTILGPVSSPSLINRSTGERITVQIDVPPREVLTIDTRTRAVLLNGASRYGNLTVDSSWFPLRPGVNDLVLDDLLGDKSRSAVARWRSAWL